MRYLLLIYESENQAEPPTEEELGRWFQYTEDLKNSGCYHAGEALQPTATATTVRGNGTKVLSTDGPFAETREQLGGFYMVDCKDLDEAMSWASKMPNIHRGSVEVRPIMEFEQA